MPIYTSPDANIPKVLEDYPTTLMDMVSSSMGYAMSENITAMASRWAQRKAVRYVESVRSENFISIDEANEVGKEHGLEPFKRAVSPFELELLVDQAKAQNLRLSRMAAYKGAGATPIRIATGFLAGFVDPTEILVSFIPISPMLKIGKTAAGLAKGAANARRLGRAAEGAVEGAFGAAVTEPARYMFASDEQMDYDMMDSLMNVTFGAGLGSALHVGIGKLQDFVDASSKRAEAIQAGEAFTDVDAEVSRLQKANDNASVPERIAAAAPETHPNALRATMAQMDNGHRPMVAEEVLALDSATALPHGFISRLGDLRDAQIEADALGLGSTDLLHSSLSDLEESLKNAKAHNAKLEDEILGPDLAKLARRADKSNVALKELESSSMTPEQEGIAWGADPRIADTGDLVDVIKWRKAMHISDADAKNITPEFREEVTRNLVDELKYLIGDLSRNPTTAKEREAVIKLAEASRTIRKIGADPKKFTSDLISAYRARFADIDDADFMIDRLLEIMGLNPKAATETSAVVAEPITNERILASAQRVQSHETTRPASLTAEPQASEQATESLAGTQEQIDFDNPESIAAETDSAQRTMEDATARALQDNPDLAEALGISVETSAEGGKPKLKFPEIESADAEVAVTQKNVRQALNDVADCLIGF